MVVETGVVHAMGAERALGIAMVRNKADHAGQKVTVSFNFLDAAGALIATGSEESRFSWVGELLPIIAEADVPPSTQIASVEATLLVKDDGVGDVQDALDPVKGTVAKSDDLVTAKFILTNPDDAVLENVAAVAVCRDRSGKINGAESGYLDLMAPKAKAALDIDIYDSGAPVTSCTAYWFRSLY